MNSFDRSKKCGVQDISMLRLGNTKIKISTVHLCQRRSDRFKVNQLFKFLLRQWEFPWWLSTSSPTNLTNSPSIKLMVWTFQRLRYTLTGRHFVNFATISTSIWLRILICWNNITRKVSNTGSFCAFNTLSQKTVMVLNSYENLIFLFVYAY